MNNTLEELNILLTFLLDKNGKVSSSKLLNRKDIVDLINSSVLLKEFNTINEKIWAIKNNTTQKPLCVCGNILIFQKKNNIFFRYCSRTCIEKIKNHKIKNIESIIKKYGVSNISQIEEIKEKIKNNNLKKYGVSNTSKLEDIKNKTKFTNLKKYGFEYSNQNENIKIKINNSRKNNFIKNKLTIKLEKIKELYNIVPFNWSKEDFISVNNTYDFKHLNCEKIFKSTLDDGKIPRCPKCHMIFKGKSKIEEKLQNDLFNIFKDNIIFNDRNIIKPKELDIVINNNLAIEINGSYWHNNDIEKISLLEKSNICPIPILHFWDFELENKYEICKSIILNKLGKTKNKIFARKCKIKTIDSLKSSLFLENNHLQGSSNSKYNYGLYYENELVQILTVGKPRFNKNYDWEIHRISTKLHTQVVGGISKLFKYIQKELGGSFITYADKRYSKGNIYKLLGFKELKDSSPNYYWGKNNVILSRYQCQKHKLNNLLKVFDEKLTESENMKLNGYYKFSDCGNKVFVIK